MHADEYVTAKLIETEEKLEQSRQHVRTLEEDLEALHTDMMNIRKVFKIELASNEKEYKIVYYRDPANTWNTDILAWSGSLKEEEFKDEFKRLMKVLHLELPDEDAIDLDALEDLEGSNEVK